MYIELPYFMSILQLAFLLNIIFLRLNLHGCLECHPPFLNPSLTLHSDKEHNSNSHHKRAGNYWLKHLSRRNYIEFHTIQL